MTEEPEQPKPEAMEDVVLLHILSPEQNPGTVTCSCGWTHSSPSFRTSFREFQVHQTESRPLPPGWTRTRVEQAGKDGAAAGEAIALLMAQMRAFANSFSETAARLGLSNAAPERERESASLFHALEIMERECEMFTDHGTPPLYTTRQFLARIQLLRDEFLGKNTEAGD